jgi:phospholipid-transporting ATPase
MNKLVVVIFVVQVVFCILSAVAYVIWYHLRKDNLDYLMIKPTDFVDNSPLYNFFIRFGNWMLIFSNFVPISLLVTLETVKFIQGYFITKDATLESPHTPAGVQSSNLNEELGQIHYIFSDKTGTLTCNLMEFKKISIGGKSYGEVKTIQDISRLPVVTNVDFRDQSLFDDLSRPQSPAYDQIKATLILMALCHTILVEYKDGEYQYNASSPDELALLNWAKFCGCEFRGTDEDNNMTVIFKGETLKYKQLQLLEFNSTRKRNSIIIKDAQGVIKLFCKGADTILFERMNKNEYSTTLPPPP